MRGRNVLRSGARSHDRSGIRWQELLILPGDVPGQLDGGVAIGKERGGDEVERGSAALADCRRGREVDAGQEFLSNGRGEEIVDDGTDGRRQELIGVDAAKFAAAYAFLNQAQHARAD